MKLKISTKVAARVVQRADRISSEQEKNVFEILQHLKLHGCLKLPLYRDNTLDASSSCSGLLPSSTSLSHLEKYFNHQLRCFR